MNLDIPPSYEGKKGKKFYEDIAEFIAHLL